jgi:hypothetical protein
MWRMLHRDCHPYQPLLKSKFNQSEVDPTCPICKLETETMIQVITSCPLYNEIRKEHFVKIKGLKFSLLVCMAWHRTFDAVSISYIRSSFFGSRPVITSFWQSMTSWHMMSFFIEVSFPTTYFVHKLTENIVISLWILSHACATASDHRVDG